MAREPRSYRVIQWDGMLPVRGRGCVRERPVRQFQFLFGARPEGVVFDVPAGREVTTGSGDNGAVSGGRLRSNRGILFPWWGEEVHYSGLLAQAVREVETAGFDCCGPYPAEQGRLFLGSCLNYEDGPPVRWVAGCLPYEVSALDLAFTGEGRRVSARVEKLKEVSGMVKYQVTEVV